LNYSGLYIIIKCMDDDFEEPTGPKDYDEQTDAFRFDLDDLVERYLHEFDINTITMIGALQEKIQELVNDGGFEADLDIDE
jgi:hypothetical protein